MNYLRTKDNENERPLLDKLSKPMTKFELQGNMK